MFDLELLEILPKPNEEEVNPAELYKSNGFEFSRATFYRKLDRLKSYGLITWRRGKVKLTPKGEKLLQIIKSHDGGAAKTTKFVLMKSERLKELDNFVYVLYPTPSDIIRAIAQAEKIDLKGFRSNAEKLQALILSKARVNLAVDNFENASKQALVILKELIYAGTVKKLYVGVNDEKKAFRNQNISEFLHRYNFENDEFKLEADAVNIFPALIAFLIVIGLVIAYRLGYQHATVYSFFIIIYFLRSQLFREIRR